ncbi:MAG: methyltransferase domain-containing protein [Cyanobacteria bacterium]|nr:methyltransferase domain-containing protein [Cyanobacteriota bacterium]
MVASPAPSAAEGVDAPRYLDIPNWDLLRLLPPDARRLVDVGCNAGALGLHYKRINPQCHYAGLEIDAPVAAIARTRLDRVEVVNVEDPANDALFEPGSVDCLIYGDMLEHAIDPWALLKRHQHWLSDRGVIIACIPNVQHWTIWAELLRGQWTYQDTGLLDRTHLRFFTLDSIKDLFTGAGLELLSIYPRYGNRREVADTLAAQLQGACELLKGDASALADRLATIQYIVRARRPAPTPPRRLLIQTCIHEPVACKRVRVSEPDAFLDRLPGVRTHATENGASIGIEHPGEEVVFIWQRAILSREKNLSHMRRLIQRGYVSILEIDDDPLRWPAVAASDFWGYRACHAIQTSTEQLADFLRQINPNVTVFPNAIAALPRRRPPTDPQAPTTIFFGSLNRRPDWLPLLPAINRVLADRGDRVRVEVIYDQAFFDALETPHKTFQPLVPFETYGETLSRCDIALLPLNPTRFNAMKSDLSFVECAARGVAVLASPVAYGATLRDGETGLLFKTPGQFERRLAALIDRPDLRDRLTANAYDWVKTQRMLAGGFRDRYDWYLQLRDRLPELNGQLRDRLPELFAES